MSREGLRPLAWAGLVAAWVLVVYHPARHHAFLNYDDDVYITANPVVARGLDPESLRFAVTSFHGANWFPLTWLSWMTDVELQGLDPTAFHRTSVLLHALSAAVLCLALARLTGRVGPAAFAAGVFAAHPLHVESVAWAAARKDPLSGLFFSLALLCYAPPRGGRPGAARLSAVFACMALGLLAKPILVVLPAILLLLDFWPLRRFETRPRGAALRGALLEKLPHLALAAVFCAIALVAQGRGGTLVDLDRLPPGARVANAAVAGASYLGKALWPVDLAVLYPHPVGALPATRVAACAALLLGLGAVALWQGRRRPHLLVGWLWYLVALLPVIGLVQVGSQAMADRYTYLPLTGPALALAFAAREQAARLRAPRGLLPALGVAWVLALGAASALQLRHWRDSEALFRHALEVTERNPIAHAHLAAALQVKGEHALAVFHYRASLRLAPDAPEVANNLAWILATSANPALRSPDEALALAEAAAGADASDDPRRLDTLAAALASVGRFDDAVLAAERGLASARGRGDPALARGLEQRLHLYRSRRPVRHEP